MSDTLCSRCHKPFPQEPVAFITGRIFGDECTDCYYWCEACQVYTVRLYRDAFCGEETSHESDPIPKEEGDRRVALIRSCPEPYEGRCKCAGHRAYFGEVLD